MKKYSFLIILILNWSYSYCQVPNIVNGDFTSNAGNDITLFSCPTFSMGSVTNWLASHGTPQISGTTNDDMYVFFSPNSGEGIVGGYRFTVGEAYCIQVRLVAEDYRGGQLTLSTGNLPMAISISACQQPTNLPSGVQSIGSMNASDGLVKYFEYEPTVNTTLLSVFPESNGDRTDVWIDRIDIMDACVNNKCFTNGLVAPAIYDAKHICAGSSFGGPSMVVNDPNSVTEFRASREITIADNFLATANSGNYFLADVNIFNCYCFPDVAYKGSNSGSGQQSPPMEQWGDGDSSYSAQGVLKERHAGVKIFPNPSAGSFTIQSNVKSNFRLKVVNMVGEIIYQSEMVDEMRKDVSLPSSIPSGNYTIHINGDNSSYVEKLTITK
jgi:hypothetical protein